MLAKLLVASLDNWFGLTLARWTALAMVSGEAYAGGGGVPLPPPPFAGGAAAAAPTLPHAYAAEAAAALPLLFVAAAGGEAAVDATPVVVIPAAAGGSGEPQALPPGGTAWPPFRPLDGAADYGVDSGVRSVPIWFNLGGCSVVVLLCSWSVLPLCMSAMEGQRKWQN